MLTDYQPHTAEIDGNQLIFFDYGFPLARCELHEDQDFEHDVPDTVDIWPDSGSRNYIRLKPETLRVFDDGRVIVNGAESFDFHPDSRRFILEDFPALAIEAERRANLDPDDEIEKPCADAIKPLRRWLREISLPKPDYNRAALFYHYYRMRTAPMPTLPSEATARAFTSHLRAASVAARPIDDFNEGWKHTERWPDAPQTPDGFNKDHPAICEQLNSAIRRVVTMAQKPRTFRADRVAGILGALANLHPETYSAVVDVIREKGCALSDIEMDAAIKKFEDAVVREVQGKTRRDYVKNAKGDKAEPGNSDNVRMFLNLRGVDVRFDEFASAMEMAENQSEYDWQWKRLDEDRINALWLDAHSSAHNFQCSREFFRSGIERLARENTYDALRDAVDTLQWDGVPRLGNWLSFAIGCPDDSYHRAVGANLIGGLVKRARDPGCKHDETVILISPEGSRKSSFCKALALRGEWFTDSIQLGGRPQDIIPQLKGKQVIELAELDGLSRSETNNVKAFLSRTNDHATLKYERDAREHLRRHLFVGTTNEDAPLISQTGNRRWLPVHVVGQINIEWVRENIAQLYAEAAAWHADGEDFRIPEALWSIAGQHQEAARYRTGAEDILSHAFDGVGDCYITAADVALFAGERRLHLKEVRAALKRLGFASVAQREGDEVRKVWRRGPVDFAARFKAVTFTNAPCELKPEVPVTALPVPARA